MEGEEKSEEEETGEESGVIGHQIPDGNASEPCYNLREFSPIGRWKILPAWRMDIGLGEKLQLRFPLSLLFALHLAFDIYELGN